jgi:Holliday junction resolvase-like predicted endonuclease
VIRTARLFLAEGGLPAATSYRFDVVAVTFFDDDHRPPRVVHVAAAFETA